MDYTCFAQFSDGSQWLCYDKEQGMKHRYVQTPQATHLFLLATCVAALAVAFIAVQPQRVHADDIEVPEVPDNLEVPEGHKVFLKGHAIGTQNYMCLPDNANNPTWMPIGPQATLFNDKKEQIIHHFLSPNPDENGMPPRATWQHSRDTSTIWAVMATNGSSSDPMFVEPGAIPWLLLEVVGDKPGPTGGERLTKTEFIQRLNTSGGIAPTTACTVGQRAFVPYKADYFFYKATKHE
jgi:hypothetical protein